MDQADLLRRIAVALDAARVRYVVTGSLASSAYGESRFTNDIDVVADLTPERLVILLAAFPADAFYVSEQAARSAVLGGGQFNLIHPESGQKVDLIVPANAFDRALFDRAVRLRAAPDLELPFIAPEDLILKKMEFYREGGSEKHLRDITGMLRSASVQLDLRHIDRSADDLGLTEIWRAVRHRAGGT